MGNRSLFRRILNRYSIYWQAKSMASSSIAVSPIIIISATDCTICATVSSLVRTRQPTEELVALHSGRRLRTVEEYTESATKCPVCQAILSRLVRDCVSNSSRQLKQDDVVDIKLCKRLDMWEIRILENGYSTRRTTRGMWTVLSTLTLIPEVDKLNRLHFMSEPHCLINDRVDFSRIKRWISHCDGHHSGTCFQVTDPWQMVDSPEGFYLVDVEKECVSSARSTIDGYVALSYVWGTAPSPLVLTKDGISSLCAPYSLAESSSLGKILPQTIRDAMMVTKNLGYRYLWVDRLCIVQDDEVHKPAQIAAMAAIYGNSALTIVADNAGDNEGLPGVDPVRSTERRSFSVLSLPGDVRLVVDAPEPLGSDSLVVPDGKTYNSRGWTLQEELLSKRTLRFTRQEVTWTCRKSKFREILNDERQIEDDLDEDEDTSVAIKLYKHEPDLETYGNLAIDYTSRSLTYDTDAAAAFSAIIATFSRSMRGGMLYGLPELFFEVVLLWQSAPSLRRRRPCSEVPPSWSFLGWQGSGLSLDSWWDFFPENYYDPSGRYKVFLAAVRVLPCFVEFYKTDRCTSERSIIRSSYFEEETDAPSSSSDDGKSAASNDSDVIGAHLFDDAGWYLHEVLNPGDPYIPDPVPSRWAPILTVRTQMCDLITGDTFLSDNKDVGLLSKSHNGNNSESIIGVLRSDGKGDNDPYREMFGRKVSLIAISRFVASQAQGHWDMPELNVFHANCGRCFWSPNLCRADRRYVPYDFYNVLWVSWADGIAYREGIGRVERRAWDDMKLEMVEIKLG